METVDPSGTSKLRVVRWTQYGQDRLYVNTADGRRVGWLNLTNGVHVVEIGSLRREFEQTLVAYEARRDGTTTTIVDEVPAERLVATANAPVVPADVSQDPPHPSELRRQKQRPNSAGASAQAEYERRATRDRGQRRATRKRRVGALLVSPFVGYGFSRLALLLFEQLGARLLTNVGGTELEIEPVFGASTSHTVGLCGALGFALLAATALLQRKQTTEAFRIGAEGERKTGAILDRLPDGWRVFHDLPMPGGRSNIDHVAVGPAGIFTVETKNYANGVIIKNGVARSSGRELAKVVDQANRQARVITERTGRRATAIVVVHGRGVSTEGWFQRATVDGVNFCSGHRLKKALVGGRATLDPSEVARIADLLEPR